MPADILTLLQAAAFRPQSLQAPSAWMGHLPFAWWLVQTQRPRSFVELGTHTGNSYFTFCQAVKVAACATLCYAVDTWQGDEHAGKYGEEIYQTVNATNSKHYSAFSSLLRMTFDQALGVIPDGTVDLLHIDGLHTYEAVRHDFETWLPKLTPDALVLFHDTHVYERGFGVWKFWKEVRAQYPHSLDFQHSHGLGVLQVGHGPACPAFEVIQRHDLELVQTYFGALGKAQLDRYFQSEAENLLKAEKDNSQAQILYRDALVSDLRNLLQAEKDNAQEQIHYRDSLLQAEKENLQVQIAIRDQQLKEAYTLKGLTRHIRRKFS